MRTRFALPTLVALTLALAGCASQPEPSAGPETEAQVSSDQAAGQEMPQWLVDRLAEYDVDADGQMQAIIEQLDQVDQQRPLQVQGSVRADHVVFSGEEGEVEVPIEGDEVYVSIAPYLTQTHDCFYHALGSCQGELVGEDVQVTITDSEGEVLVDEDVTTYANGFVGFWLPADRTGTITITDGERTGEVAFDTGPDGATCITTLQLV